MVLKIKREYYEGGSRKFRERNKKLFLSDCSKSVSFEVAAGLASEEQPGSILVASDNTTSLSDLVELLMPVSGGFSVIDNFDKFKSALGKVNETNVNVCEESSKGNMSIADKFRRKFGNIAITAGCIFEILAENNRAGVYTVADFLAECGYDFCIIDDIYEFFRLKTTDNHGFSDEVNRYHYDRIFLRGIEYHSPYTASFARLKKIAQAAESCLFLSEYTIMENAANLFAALDMLHDDFSAVGAKKKFIGAGFDYEKLFELKDLFMNYVDGYMQEIGDYCRRHFPENRRENWMLNVRKYVEDNLYAMTDEGLGLMIFDASCKVFGRCVNPDELMARFNPELMSKLIWQMLYCDEVRLKFESEAGVMKVSSMTEGDVEKAMRLFNQYGVCRYPAGGRENVASVRICRDDSGFEYYLNELRKGETLPTGDAMVYSAFNGGSLLTSKCLAIGRLLFGREKGVVNADVPAIVIFRDDEKDVAFKNLREILKCFIVSSGTNENIDYGNRVMILGETEFLQTGKWHDIKSAIFANIHSDGFLYYNMVYKALGYGAKVITILSDEEISGQIYDKVFRAVFDKEILVPIRKEKYNTKELNSFFSALALMSNGRNQNKKAPGRDDFVACATGISGQTLKVEDVKIDYDYLSGTGKEFYEIFANSASIGNCGEYTGSGEFVASRDRRGVRIATERKNEAKVVMFNVCPRQLARLCDLTVNNCNGCDEYKYRVNSFENFISAAEGFTDKSEKFVRQAREHIARRENEVRISTETADYNNTYNEEMLNVIRNAKKEISSVKEKNTDKIGKDFSVLSYEQVDGVRKAACAIYMPIIKTYYDKFRARFEEVSDRIYGDFKTIHNGLSQALKG